MEKFGFQEIGFFCLSPSEDAQRGSRLKIHPQQVVEARVVVVKNKVSELILLLKRRAEDINT